MSKVAPGIAKQALPSISQMMKERSNTIEEIERLKFELAEREKEIKEKLISIGALEFINVDYRRVGRMVSKGMLP